MVITNFEDGPFVHAVAWTTVDLCVALCTVVTPDVAEPPIAFDTRDGAPRLAYLARQRDDGGPLGGADVLRADVLPTDVLRADVLRASSVPRARSAARCTVYAALVAKALRSALSQALQAGAADPPSGEDVGVAVVSCSANVAVFFGFESVGVSNSWRDTDAMLLPASIPSAGCTAASMVTGSHAGALTFGDGLYGVCAAIEHAHLQLYHDRARFQLLLATEEASTPMTRALHALGDRRAVYDGCAGLLLSATPLAPADWQLCALAIVPEGGTVHTARPWRSGARVRVHLDNPLMAFTSTLLPLAVHEAMRFGHETGKAAALIEFHVTGRGSILIAMRRELAGSPAGPHDASSAPVAAEVFHATEAFA